jgi:hypothetical protein
MICGSVHKLSFALLLTIGVMLFDMGLSLSRLAVVNFLYEMIDGSDAKHCSGKGAF